ncbi:MAG: type III-A CRISPR-associated protein Csm2 [Draconibacterium sp.]|nr:type III-A CRISPR-associated protein Csm2 [Draconibacterium sp.]
MYPHVKLKEKWIQDQITSEAVEWSKSFGEFLQQDDSRNRGTKPLTTSQIRKFFGELKRIQADPEKYKEEIPMLKAKLAYAVGRDKNNRGQSSSKIDKLYEELETGLDAIRPEHLKEDVIRFVKLIESIVAFHKFYGGK